MQSRSRAAETLRLVSQRGSRKSVEDLERELPSSKVRVGREVHIFRFLSHEGENLIYLQKAISTNCTFFLCHFQQIFLVHNFPLPLVVRYLCLVVFIVFCELIKLLFY